MEALRKHLEESHKIQKNMEALRKHLESHKIENS
jgi:hypothetical protein|tara:strand:- start:183 stop:284 length:102 start_codon:yes stop_codon:yes gene_type:complete